MTVQYQESDYGFLACLLAEEGLGWVMRQGDTTLSSDDAAGPNLSQPLSKLVIFSDYSGLS